MNILIKEPSHKAIRIWFPTRLVLNRPAAAILFAVTREKELPFSRPQLMSLIKTLHVCRKRFPDWTLVEVTSAKGEHVKIKL